MVSLDHTLPRINFDTQVAGVTRKVYLIAYSCVTWIVIYIALLLDQSGKRSSFTNFFSLRTIYANSYQGMGGVS